MNNEISKKIYTSDEVMVTDELIEQSDDTLNKALPYSSAGTVIYTAGYKTAKQKSLDNKWIAMQLGGSSSSGAAGKDGVTPLLQKSTTAIQVSYDSGSTYSDLVALSELKGAKGDKGATGAAGAKGDKGEAGATGAKGADGADGKSAYQIWLDAGNSGNETSFLASLKGSKGDTGAKGDKGDKGETGAAGAAGKDGTNGKDGKSVTAISLTTNADGKVTGGTLTLSDNTTVPITITSADE